MCSDPTQDKGTDKGADTGADTGAGLSCSPPHLCRDIHAWLSSALLCDGHLVELRVTNSEVFNSVMCGQ